MTEEIFKQFANELEKPLSRFLEEASSLRAGRPTPALVEDVPAECYGSKMSLKEIATILVQLPNTLVIQPWDKANLQAIEKALARADVGAFPVVDGSVVRLTLPSLTQERRNELVKALHKKAEEARIAARILRDDARKSVNALALDKKISEDEKFRANERLQKIFDEFQAKTGDILAEREKTIMAV